MKSNYFFSAGFWSFQMVISVGTIMGLIAYAFYSSNAISYLSDAPSTCMNCHIMAPQYATWYHSAHREVAHCNDCHVPHDNSFRKYFFKAKDGLRHATVFTLRNEPQTIYIKPEGKKVVQENCIRCHEALVKNYTILAQTSLYFDHFKDRVCWDCHRETPHGRVNSLSSVPNARVPLPGSIVPKWLQNTLTKND